ncbi:MAG: SHOCT domain-containing protein [Solirubrobacterales bacterium]|nr:SHOCT domain-containing protein [Solirubrobacterales bacterium]
MEEYKGYNGTVELHEDRIVIRREGRRQKIHGLAETREIPCGVITGVKVKPATKFNRGCLQLQLAGAAPRRENDDPNAVFFWDNQNSRFQELAHVLKQRLADNIARGVDPTVNFDPAESRLDDVQAKQQASNFQAKHHTKPNELAGQSARGNHKVAEKTATKLGVSWPPVYWVTVNVRGTGPFKETAIFITEDQVIYGQNRVSLAGAKATVDTGGNTAVAQRWVFNERTDSRQLSLTVEGPDGGFVVPLRMAKNRAQETRARTLAMEINRRSKVLDPRSTVDSRLATSDIPDQIRKLAELRDSNIISSEEFEAKKTELLSRM